jgi:hypothetical protein
MGEKLTRAQLYVLRGYANSWEAAPLPTLRRRERITVAALVRKRLLLPRETMITGRMETWHCITDAGRAALAEGGE